MSSKIKVRLKIYLDAQLEEIYKFKWILGEQMHSDPLNKYSMNDICLMWIATNATKFRVEWIECHGSGYFDGIDNSN